MALDVTVSWSSLSVAGGGPRAAGTWILAFQPVGTAGPAAPRTDHVVSVVATDPTFHSTLQACHARIQ